MLLGLREQGRDIPDQMVRTATSFGGGVGLSKNICGCLSAAAMAVGMFYGTTEPTGTAPRPAYARTKAVMDGFVSRFGSTQCGDLTDRWTADFANSERAHKCGGLVEYTLGRLAEVLDAPAEADDWQESWWNDYLARRDKVR